MKHPNALPTGSILNSGTYQYRVLKVLGHGGFGITYLVTSVRKIENIKVNVHFAIKEHFLSEYCERDTNTLRIITGLGKQQQTVDNSMKDFIGEAKRLKQIGNGHSSIVKVNEVFEANNTAYYVMEYLEGKSLRSYVAEHGPISEDDISHLISPISDAVDYLHTCQMTHLDIKPDNIIITEDEHPDGSTVLRPVLIDFGLSKHYDKSGNATSTINTLGCSDGYSPIEQYAGITCFTPEADIYALAATMLFCLTGINPKKSTDLIHLNISEYISIAVPSITPPLLATLSNALSPISANRPKSLTKSFDDNINTHASNYKYIPEPAKNNTHIFQKRTKTKLIYALSTFAIIIFIVVGLLPYNKVSTIKENVGTDSLRTLNTSLSIHDSSTIIQSRIINTPESIPPISEPTKIDVTNQKANENEDYYRVFVSNNKQGLKDSHGRILIPAKYDWFKQYNSSRGDYMDFRKHGNEFLLKVCLNGKCGFINKKDELVIPATYDDVENFMENLCVVKLNGKYGFIDPTGNMVIPAIYDDACGFSEGLAVVYITPEEGKASKKGVINKNGEFVVPAIYNWDKMLSFSDKESKDKYNLHYYRNGRLYVLVGGNMLKPDDHFFIDTHGNRVE